MIKTKHLLFIALIALYQLLLIGCTVEPAKPKLPEVTTPEQELAQLYQLAIKSKSPDSERYRIRAATLLLQLNRLAEAETILLDISPRKLSQDLVALYAITNARLANLRFQGDKALTILQKYNDLLLQQDMPLQIQVAQVRAEAFALTENPLDSAKELISIAPLLAGPGALLNKEAIWSTLMTASTKELSYRLASSGQSDVAGWLQLAALTKNNQDDLSRQLDALNDWLNRWPNHPAALNLPDELTLLSTMVMERPQHITLMLPLKGKNGVAGRAIRDGFLSAYYAAQGMRSQTPRIDIIDTAGTDNFLALYDDAIAQGSELIIGPLQKKHVHQLAVQPDLIVPTLALNYQANGQDSIPENTPNLYQFGLSAEDEARQVARKAWQQGFSNSLVLTPNSDWGKRIAHAFADEWFQLTGLVLETQHFSDEKSYSNAIKELLNIDESERRAQRLQSLTNTKVEFTPRRRNDMDFIFIAATPKQARQIKPTLAFHFAGNVPVYATSHIFSGTTSPLLDRDLDGIIFCESPWMLGYRNNPLKKQIRQIWPATADRLGRLYALGIDAYRLFPRIKQLSVISNSKLDGATGSLALDDRGRVIRTLNWAQIRHGKIRKLN